MTMPRINISLNNDTIKKLKEISNKENRAVSKQIKHMLEFYLENNKD